jgi:hypothetical protein
MASHDDIADFNRRSKASAAVPIKEMPRLSQIVGSPDPTRLAKMQEFDRRMDEWRKSLITTGVIGAAEKQAITTASVLAASGVGAAGKNGINGKDGKDGVDGLDGKNMVAIPPDQLGLVKHVWIAFRTDGVPGTGSIMDPFDGSTADKFDALMAGFGAYTDIHIGPGVFETRGNRDSVVAGGWYAKDGWRIGGSGIDITVLKLIDCPTDGDFYWIIGNNRVGGQTGSNFVEVSDLTCDCNLRGTTAKPANGAVGLRGYYLACRRVRCVDWGTKLYGRECFVIALTAYRGAGTTLKLTPTMVEECLVDSPYEGANAFAFNSSLITVGESGKTAPDLNNYDFNGTIRRCVIDGTLANGTRLAVPPLTAMGTWGKGSLVEENLVINVDVGWWNDSWMIPNALIKNNRFINVNFGVLMNMGTALFQSYGQDSYARSYIVISAIASAGTVVSVTTAAGHGLVSGDWVDIRLTGVSQFEALHKVTVIDATHFTYVIASFTGSASVGDVVKMDSRAITSIVRGAYAGWGIVETAVKHGLLIGSIVQVGGVTGADATLYNVDYSLVIAVTDTTFTYELNGVAAADAPAGEKVWWDRSGFAPDPATPISSVGSVATVTTKEAHNYEVGDLIIVSGVQGGGTISNYNGYFRITAVLTDHTFKYQMAGTASESTTHARYQNPWTVRHIQIENNYIEVTGPPLNNGDGAVFGAGIQLHSQLGSTLQAYDQSLKAALAIYQNVNIRGNVIRLFNDVAPANSINFGIALSHFGNAIVEDNVIEVTRLDIPGSDGRLFAWQPTVPQGVARFHNNRTYEGKLVRCYEYLSGRYYDEPERTFESVQLLQAVGF